MCSFSCSKAQHFGHYTLTFCPKLTERSKHLSAAKNSIRRTALSYLKTDCKHKSYNAVLQKLFIEFKLRPNLHQVQCHIHMTKELSRYTSIAWNNVILHYVDVAKSVLATQSGTTQVA